MEIEVKLKGLDQDGGNASSPTDGGGGAAMESLAGIIATSILLGIMTLITIVGEIIKPVN